MKSSLVKSPELDSELIRTFPRLMRCRLEEAQEEQKKRHLLGSPTLQWYHDITSYHPKRHRFGLIWYQWYHIFYPFRIFRRSWVVIEFQVLSQNVPDSSCNQIFLSTCSKAYWRRRRRCLQPVSNSTTQFHPKDHSNVVRSFMMLYVTLLKNDSILDDYEVRQSPGCRIAKISQIRFDDPWWSWDET